MKDIDRALDFIARLAPRFPFLTDQEFCQIVFALIKQCPSLNKNTSTLGPRDVFPFTTCLRSSLNSGLHILRIRLWVGCDDFLRVRGIYCLGTVYIRNEQVEELGVHATQRPAQRIIRGGESECWQRERTPTPVRAFGVRLTAAGLSIRETAAVLRLLGVNRSHGAVWQWIHRLADSLADPPTATPSQVAVDELAVRINGELYWFYAAIDTETKFLLGAELFEHRGTDAATEFLRSLDEKHDLSEAVFLVDGYGYLTALARLDLSGRLDYSLRNHIENCPISSI